MTRKADRGTRTKRAKALRRQPTDAEQRLWSRLRGRQVSDRKFRRQHPIGRYVTDFVCVEAKLVVELDGGQHAEQVAYDAIRTAYLEAQGFRVVRFWSNEALINTDAVVERIADLLRGPLDGDEAGP